MKIKYLVINDFDDCAWKIVVDHFKDKIQFVEFNILYSGKELDKFISDNLDDLNNRGKKKKYFASGEYLKFSFSNPLKSFIIEKPFSFFQNNFIEDPSFIIDDIEVVATITHENQIYFSSDDLYSAMKNSGICIYNI